MNHICLEGFHADTYWAVLESDAAPIAIVFDSEDLFLRLFTPAEAADPRTTHVDFPPGDISLLHGIAPIGTKFHSAEAHGPAGQANMVRRHGHAYRGKVSFYFGEATHHERSCATIGAIASPRRRQAFEIVAMPIFCVSHFICTFLPRCVHSGRMLTASPSEVSADRWNDYHPGVDWALLSRRLLGLHVTSRTKTLLPARRQLEGTHMKTRCGCFLAGLVVSLGLTVPTAAQTAQGANTQAKVARKVLEVKEVAASGPFAPSWSSLEKFSVPDWYQDDKFGIFIHWGVYSVPAFGNEWYPRNMYKNDEQVFAHHAEKWGPQSEFGYKDFIPMLTAEKFDAARWAALFKAAGARYIVPVAEHHDGFPMYDCSFTEWSAAKMGPKRDLIGELADAVRAEGMIFGLSTHRAEHWWFFDRGMTFDSDVRDPRYAGLYGPARSREKAEDQSEPPDQAFLDDWLARTAELVDRYQPQVVWFDWWIAQPAFHQNLQAFSAFYYNRGEQWGKGVAINYKKHGGESFPDTAGVLDIERGQLAGLRSLFWQTDTSVSKTSWGYVTNHEYKTVDSIVDDLVDIVSKNGSLLLNIGPKPDGTIPQPEQQILRGIGQWLDVNGEAIYKTRPFSVFGEGPTAVVEGPFADTKRGAFTAEDVRFTTRGDTLYAIVLAWPESGRATVKSLARGGPHLEGDVVSVALLGADTTLDWTQDETGLHVELPSARPTEHAFALRVTK